LESSPARDAILKRLRQLDVAEHANVAAVAGHEKDHVDFVDVRSYIWLSFINVVIAPPSKKAQRKSRRRRYPLKHLGQSKTRQWRGIPGTAGRSIVAVEEGRGLLSELRAMSGAGQQGADGNRYGIGFSITSSARIGSADEIIRSTTLITSSNFGVLQPTATTSPGNWIDCRTDRNTGSARQPSAGLAWGTGCCR
jgi:hypothetical protein